MTTELEIDKEEFDSFVRQTLGLPQNAAVTDFHYGLIEDRLKENESALVEWLESRHGKQAMTNEYTKSMKDNPPRSQSPQPGATPAKSPSPASTAKPAAPATGKAAGDKAAAAAGKPAATARPAAATRAAKPVTARKVKAQSSGGLKFLWSLLSMLLVLSMVVYVACWYLPLETREQVAKAEWMKSVPKALAEAILFHGKREERQVTLERGKPQVTEFSVSKSFRVFGSVEIGGGNESIIVEARLEKPNGPIVKSETIELGPGNPQAEAFDDLVPAGTYRIALELKNETTRNKIPVTFVTGIRY